MTFSFKNFSTEEAKNLFDSVIEEYGIAKKNKENLILFFFNLKYIEDVLSKKNYKLIDLTDQKIVAIKYKDKTCNAKYSIKNLHLYIDGEHNLNIDSSNSTIDFDKAIVILDNGENKPLNHFLLNIPKKEIIERLLKEHIYGYTTLLSILRNNKELYPNIAEDFINKLPTLKSIYKVTDKESDFKTKKLKEIYVNLRLATNKNNDIFKLSNEELNENIQYIMIKDYDINYIERNFDRFNKNNKRIITAMYLEKYQDSDFFLNYFKQDVIGNIDLYKSLTKSVIVNRLIEKFGEKKSIDLSQFVKYKYSAVIKLDKKSIQKIIPELKGYDISSIFDNMAPTIGENYSCLKYNGQYVLEYSSNSEKLTNELLTKFILEKFMLLQKDEKLNLKKEMQNLDKIIREIELSETLKTIEDNNRVYKKKKI